MTLYNKLLAGVAASIIITSAFLIASVENGTNIQITAFPNSSLGQDSGMVLYYNSSFVESYGSGGYLSIYSDYSSNGKPLSYAWVIQQLIVERGTSDGNEWRAQCDRSFNMTGTEFSQAHLNLTPGYYRLEFATMLVYHNASDFYNNTLPALHSAFLDIKLPYPSVLVVTLEIELSILAALLALDYARFRSTGYFL